MMRIIRSRKGRRTFLCETWTGADARPKRARVSLGVHRAPGRWDATDKQVGATDQARARRARQCAKLDLNGQIPVCRSISDTRESKTGCRRAAFSRPVTGGGTFVGPTRSDL
jgi:hypothetical protein